MQTSPHFHISSTAFKNNQQIPSQYTCDGKNTNPPLVISNVPPGTKSIALVLDDPDSPSGLWTHWILFNLDPSTTSIPEHFNGGEQGRNSFGQLGYGGPCPHQGQHHYVFHVFALDLKLVLVNLDRHQFDSAITGHVLATSEFIGIYQRPH